METVCEFCKSLNPIVYCKADAAHLCLSCDAKVHSANSLSYRHSRTLVCESCRSQPAFVGCFVCGVFMCKSCDDVHDDLQQQQQQHKRELMISSSYVGSPCAKELAALWGFGEGESIQSQSQSQSQSLFATKVCKDDDSKQPNTCSVLQQILHLERIQLISHNNSQHESIDRNPQNEIRIEEDPYYSSPFDSFSQCKNNELIWLHDMQDLGVCDEVDSFDDVQIPDVDLIFRNFDEVFGNQNEPSRELVHDNKDIDIAGSKYSSFGKFCPSTIEVCAHMIKTFPA
ncbi:hypothetical protein ACJIZ3_020137 [Penstemon smallii]|uniref:B box-type domain-containing protein n=1 Tax=Penstemon smallii TaxID=265156 RepID=A0ABD3SHY5_9LAMI